MDGQSSACHPLQAHLVLESPLPFRLILYWIRLVLDSAFRAHLCLVFFFCGGDSESVPAVIAAYSGVRRVQGAGPLSRLLVLDTARAAVAISASVETESRARIRREIWAEDPGRDRNVLWRAGRRDEEPFRAHLFHRIRPSAGGAGHTQIRAR